MTIPRSIIQDVIIHLRQGGLVVYPTETSYAVGCDATHAAAVRAVFRLKGRAAGKSLPLIVASRAMAERYAVFTPHARRLARTHWPGPLTMVLALRAAPMEGSMLAYGTIARNRTIALRISSHPVARALSRRLGRPIVATSANIFGKPPAHTARAARRTFRSSVEVRILDGGVLPRSVPSTIVDVTDGVPRILRQGIVRIGTAIP